MARWVARMVSSARQRPAGVLKDIVIAGNCPSWVMTNGNQMPIKL